MPKEKYRIETEDGSAYEIETEDAQPQQAATQQSPDQSPSAFSRFFSSLGDVLKAPIAGVSEYIDRPSQWAAVSDVLGTKRGTPEEAAALERGMNVPLPLPGGMGEVMPMGAHPAARALEQTSRGDIAGAAGTLTGGYAIPYGVGKVIPKVATQEGRAALAKTTRDVAETVETGLVGPRPPVKLMNQALRPINTNIKFDQAVDTALPEIKVSEAAIGRPITNIHDMLEAVKDAKKRVWGQREAITGEQGARPITLEPVADAMERTITQRLELQDPARAAAIRAKAATYRGRTFTIQEAEDLLHGANDELHSYYAKNPLIKRVEEGRNPDTAAMASEAKVLRDRIYGELDQAGQGAGPRELSRRYGSLVNMEGEIYRRMKVADRQAQYNLSEQFANAQGLAEAGVGALTGHPLMAMGGLLKKQLAKELKEAEMTDRLIERTFRNYTGKPLAVTVQKMEPKGLLTSGPIVTPPPADPSGITITTGPPLQPRIKGYLPAPPLVTPPPVDPSGITVTTGPPLQPAAANIVNAARRIARDPKTGRLYVY
jgi:hypothetical protein